MAGGVNGTSRGGNGGAGLNWQSLGTSYAGGGGGGAGGATLLSPEPLAALAAGPALEAARLTVPGTVGVYGCAV